MITESEVAFISDLLQELVAICDEPSEYIQEEVDQALEILQSLRKYDTQKIVNLIEGNTND